MKVKDFCRDCGEPLYKKEDGLCRRCVEDRLRERMKKNDEKTNL